MEKYKPTRIGRGASAAIIAIAFLLGSASRVIAVDSDADGLSDAEEQRLGTSPDLADTDRDGLLDGWEVHGIGGWNLQTLGANPRHADLLIFVTRRPDVPAQRVNDILSQARQFYSRLRVENPDGVAGVSLIRIGSDSVTAPDFPPGYEGVYARYFPSSLRGIAHFMELYNDVAGQSPVLGDRGAVGALNTQVGWQTFAHEMGHQLGLDHAGGGDGSSPLHTSLMNYAYSYEFGGQASAVHYSDGSFSALRLQEAGLPEQLPWPIGTLDFLRFPPYEFKLQAAGTQTNVDWNRNGVFGESGVVADINAWQGCIPGPEELVTRSIATAPWIFTTPSGRLAVAYGTISGAGNDLLSASRSGRIWLRLRNDDGRWMEPIEVGSGGAIGAPTAVSSGTVRVAYQVAGGILTLQLDETSSGFAPRPGGTLFQQAGARVDPVLANLDGRLYLFLWNQTTGAITYRREDGAGEFEFGDHTLPQGQATTGIGVTFDPRGRGSVAVAFGDRSEGPPDRVVIQKYRIRRNGRLRLLNRRLVGGATGLTSTAQRPAIVFDDSFDDAAAGGPNASRFALYYRRYNISEGGLAGEPVYMSQEVRDRTYRDGWTEARLVANTTTAVSAVRFGTNVALARLQTQDDQTRNHLYVHYRASCIENGTLADIDELGLIRDEGLVRSLGAWSTWAEFGGPVVQFANSPPIATRYSSGRLAVFTRRGDGNLWQTSQGAPGDSLLDWSSLGRPSSDTLRSLAVTRPGGLVHIFAPGATGAIWHIFQSGAEGSFGAWQSRGRPASTRVGPFAAAGLHGDGRLAVFSVGIDDGKLWFTSQRAPNGAWAGWVDLGRPTPALSQRLAVGRNTDGRLEVVATASDGNIWHTYQTSANGPWRGWESLGQPSSTPIAQAVTIAANPDGRLEIFAVGDSGDVWHLYQLSGGGWGPWSSIRRPPIASFAGDSGVAVVERTDGLTLFAQDRVGKVWFSEQNLSTADGWDDWIRLGQPATASLEQGVAGALNLDGRAEIFARTQNGKIRNIYER